VSAAAVVGLTLAGCASANQSAGTLTAAHWGVGRTATPIKHLVVLFDENVSFDHYFGTYPNATNADGTTFTAAKHTPGVNGLTPALLNTNPNLFNPQRLAATQALTCDQNHGYGAEQKAVNGGQMNLFVQSVETSKCTGQPILFGQPGLVMDYYDGNTVTGLWNYARHYAMSDNSFDTQFGPSTPGALNLISGSSNDAIAVNPKTGAQVTDPSVAGSPNAQGVGTVFGDPDPAFDDCSGGSHASTNNLAALQGRNVGDLLDQKSITWGWFQGGFKPTSTNTAGFAVCGAAHANIGGFNVPDYSPHHNPFSYYQSTSNPKHLPPSSPSMIGKTDQANHNYDLTDFNTALKGDNLPAVSFLKASEYQDGHPGYSDPLDEQTFLATEINAIQKSPQWRSTAIVVAYDDSDGWYDHVNSKIVNGSQDTAKDAAICTGVPIALTGGSDRCGYGPRLPMLVISPFSKENFVDHSRTDQSSVAKFIEDNWRLSRIGNGSYDKLAGTLTTMFNFHEEPNTRPLILDPKTGAVVSKHY